MTNGNRKSGIDVIGDAPWGTHFCQFYQTREDLIDILVPYFKAGLENNEFCMWVTSEPFNEKEAEKAIRKAVPDFDLYLQRGQIEILPHDEWYFKDGIFDLHRVLDAWVDKLDRTLSSGYDGMRVSGNTAWLEKNNWRIFAEYEEELNRVIGNYRLMAICTYSLGMCGAPEVIDVVSNHRFALIRRNGKWVVIESAEQAKVKAALQESEKMFRLLAENTQDLVYRYRFLPTAGFEYVSPSAIAITGYTPKEHYADPELGFKIVHPDDRPLLASVAQFPEKHKETVSLRWIKKDGTIVWTEQRNTPIYDNSGKVIAIEGIARDITERKRAEEEIKHLNLTLRAIRNVNQLISREKDRSRLLQEICRLLTATRSYSDAWVALLDESGKLLAHAEAGWGKDFAPMLERLKLGEIPVCGQKALVQASVVATRQPASTCAGCPLSDELNDNGALTVRLEHAGKVYGLLNASIPGAFITDEEISLFKEVTDDVAFALHDIELEEESRLAVIALQEAKEKYRDLYENAPVPYFSVDSKGIIRECNKAAHLWLGYQPGELNGKTRLAVYTEESKSKAKDLFENFKRGIAIEDEELTFGRKDGQNVYGLLSMNAIKDRDGRITANRGVVKDITERKRAEEALKESEKNFHRSLDDSPLGIRIINAEGETLYANRSILDIYGYDSLEELNKIPTKKRYTPESYTEHQVRKGKRQRNELVPSNYEISIVRKDGEIRHLSVSRGEVIWNGEKRFQSLYEDITERKRLEQALAAEKERLEVTLRSTGDGVISTDLEGKVVFLNRIAEELTGWTQEESAGKPLSEVFHVIHELSRKQIGNPVEKVLKTGRVIGLINHAVLVSRNGTERIIADSGAPVRDEEGKLFGVVMVFRDVTELRKLQKEAQKVEKLQSIGTLAGGIAHDFNNILTGILGNITLAERYIEPEGKAAERLLEARKASMRAKDLTQQLLTFSKGGAPIKKTAFVTELIQDSATFALRGSNVKCEFSLPDELWPIDIDEGQINQVIANLVINAVEAMPNGGILNIRAKNTEIKRRGALPLDIGKYVEITVEDQGIGIPKEHLDRIFEPYFTTKQKGSGLGLSTSYSIIKSHDGYITVESELGVGTTFHIYLPASEKPAPRKEKTAKDVPVRGSGRILVMDDEETIREMLSQMLYFAGYEVELSKDGAEAVEKYAKARESGKPFDAVIMDLTIPGGMGGKEAIKKLLEIDPNVKAIVSSGYATDPIMSEYNKYGFSAVVSKPYSVGELEKTMRNVLTQGKSYDR